jgi:hypothetical protein
VGASAQVERLRDAFAGPSAGQGPAGERRVLYLPHLEVWWRCATRSLRGVLLFYLSQLPLRGPVLVLATSQLPLHAWRSRASLQPGLHPELARVFDFATLELSEASSPERRACAAAWVERLYPSNAACGRDFEPAQPPAPPTLGRTAADARPRIENRSTAFALGVVSAPPQPAKETRSETGIGESSNFAYEPAACSAAQGVTGRVG